MGVRTSRISEIHTLGSKSFGLHQLRYFDLPLLARYHYSFIKSNALLCFAPACRQDVALLRSTWQNQPVRYVYNSPSRISTTICVWCMPAGTGDADLKILTRVAKATIPILCKAPLTPLSHLKGTSKPRSWLNISVWYPSPKLGLVHWLGLKRSVHSVVSSFSHPCLHPPHLPFFHRSSAHQIEC